MKYGFYANLPDLRQFSKRFHYDWSQAGWQLNKIGENSWKQFNAVQKWFIAGENDIKPLETAETPKDNSNQMNT